MNSSLYLLIISALIAFSCKQQQIVTSIPITDKQQDKDTVHQATPLQSFLITYDGDTLDSLGVEVDIELFRVKKDTLIIIGVGDIMMGTNFPSDEYLPADNARGLWTDVRDTLRQADVTFGNLEGVILNEGGNQKNCNNPKVCYLFRSPDSYVDNLVQAGFDVVSLANNHAGDFGTPGRESTMHVLKVAGIEYAGLQTDPITIFKRNGMTYGLAAFSPNTGTQLIHDLPRAKELVSYLDSLVDVVIVSFHAGAEGAEHQHVTRKREFYYGEDRGNVYEFARQMIDAGADVIFGHGPHVTRAMDVYKDRFIAYSLGNFCTYGRFNLSGVKGIAPIAKIYTDGEGRFLKGELISTYQPGAGGARFDAQNRAALKAKELTQKDFPESRLRIDDSGFIFYLDR